MACATNDRAQLALSFRRACSQFATGVTAVTAVDRHGAFVALTANSFTSVSLEPALVSVCIGRDLPSFALLQECSHVAVHVLTEAEEEVARLFATAGVSAADRLAGLAWERGPDGEPWLQDCAARLSGPIYGQLVAGDHVIFLVEVTSIHIPVPEVPTLIFHRGQFGSSAGVAN
jgi:flavin reductase (DIM6/NTAB) family NADH-FMN oxidoreductase RutF